MKFLNFLAASLISSLWIPAVAFADCNTDVGSLRWNELSDLMNQAYQDQDYNAALNYSLQLKDMCKSAPTLLYIISDIYQQKGDDANSDEYIRLAHHAMARYEVPEELEERINIRYDEVIAKTPIALKVVELNEQIDTLKKQLDEANNSNTSVVSSNEDLEFVRKLKWTGTGLAVGGAVLAAIGGTVYYFGHDDIVTSYQKYTPNDGSDAVDAVKKVDLDNGGKKEQAGAVVLGIGSALAVAGTALAIVSFVKEKDIEEKSAVSFQLNAGLTNVGFSMTF